MIMKKREVTPELLHEVKKCVGILNVHDLNREQLIQLKQQYLTDVVNHDEGTSYDELARADELVSDKTIYDYFEGIDFVEEDFTI